MEKIMIEKEVFTFDEVREKALEKNFYVNHYDGWDDGIICSWNDKLAEYGFCNPEIHYSGFSYQCNGACFDCDQYHIDLDAILDNLDLTEDEKERIYNLKDKFEVIIDTIEHHYNHEYTRTVDVRRYIDDADDDALLDKFENLLEEFRIWLCQQIYEDLDNKFWYIVSDDAIEESIKNCLFNEDGTIFEYRE